jgi:hypothetical protein
MRVRLIRTSTVVGLWVQLPRVVVVVVEAMQHRLTLWSTQRAGAQRWRTTTTTRPCCG